MREFLAFQLLDELYGAPIVKVREILGGTPNVTRLPSSSAFLRGLINLRGAVIPIVDLREAFHLPALPYGPTTVIIVTEVAGTTVGLVVDSVVDVVRLSEHDVQPPPANLSARVRVDFVEGLAQAEARLLILLDLDKILTDEEIGVLRSATSS